MTKANLDDEREGAPIVFPESVTIDRERWTRGPSRDSVNHLYDSDTDCYCPLGFLLDAAGVAPAHLDARVLPSECEVEGWPERLIRLLLAPPSWQGRSFSSAFAHCVASVNDWAWGSEADCEAQLERLFAERGIKLTFIN